MHADAYFAGGRGHSVCQDYARAGVTAAADEPARVYAIVSDGCSTSPDTDFGARLLTLAAVEALTWNPDTFVETPAAMAARANQMTLLPATESLDATLLVVYERTDGLLEAVAWGDGVIFARRRDGKLLAWEIDMVGFPGYLSYELNPSRMQAYLAEAGRRVVRYSEDGEVQAATEDSFREARDFRLQFDPAEFSAVGVASDGLLAFRETATNRPVPLAAVLNEVADIRVPTGRFIERSSGFFLRKTCPRLGWQPVDDYAAAAVWCGA